MSAKTYNPLPLWPAIAATLVGAGLLVLGRVLALAGDDALADDWGER